METAILACPERSGGRAGTSKQAAWLSENAKGGK
jgi:hypothetical protein